MNIFSALNGTRLTARCHFTGPKKFSISTLQPPPTCPRKGIRPHQNHYVLRRINHTCINRYFVLLAIFLLIYTFEFVKIRHRLLSPTRVLEQSIAAMPLVAAAEERPAKLENEVVLGRPIRYTGSGRRTA